jgi:hypothetical protein
MVWIRIFSTTIRMGIAAAISQMVHN